MTVSSIFSVEGKVAFVTGASGGLGRAMAEALAENGAKVALFDIDADAMERTAEDLRGLGADVLTFAGDVRYATALSAAVDSTVKHFGKLDIAVANAGVSDRTGAKMHEADPQDWQRVVGINLGGVYNTCRPALAAMMAAGSGKIITVASMWGVVAPGGLINRPAYAASKGAVVNLTRELGIEYARHNIQVNAICPGFFRTATRPRDNEQAQIFADYTPMGRIAEAHEIKGALLYLASSASDFVTGATLAVDGGITAR